MNIRKRTLALAALLMMGLASSVQAMTEEDSRFIEQMTKEVKELIQSSEGHVQAFTDKNNKTPLRVYITEFHEKMKFVHAAILVPLQNRLNEPTIDPNSTFYKTLKTTEELIIALTKELDAFYKVFTSPTNLKKAITLATALGQRVEQMAKKYDFFEQKLVIIRGHFVTLELNDLVQEIDGIIVLIKKAKIQKQLTASEKAQIVLMLGKRMK